MFNPMQAQAAIQNPVRFPDQKLQQYAAGNPPQPTGQVTPPMAGQELAMRNQGRQAFQRQQAMQDNPENSPTVFQQKDMQLQQAMQALQQKEQQLGLAGAMLAKKQQDLAARERGIAALPINPNMFTAMDGGIVFSGGGKVQGFSGADGSLVAGQTRRALSPEERAALESMALNLQNRMMGVSSGFPRVGTIENAAPTTTKSSTPNTAPVRNVASAPTNAPSAASPAEAGSSKSSSLKDVLAELDPYLKRTEEENILEKELVALYEELGKAVKEGRMTEQQAKAIMDAKIRERQDIYGEYTKGRGDRQKKMEAALRGKAPDIGDYLGAMAAGGPGKTLAETLSRMVPGAFKLRADQQAREMAVAKYAAEAEELNAKADMLQKMGDIDAAERARDAAIQRKREETAIRVEGIKTQATGIAPLLQGARSEREGVGRAATDVVKDRMAGERAIATAEATARANARYREPREPNVYNQIYADLSSGDPARVANANAFLAGRSGGATRGQLSEGQVAKAIADFNDPFKGEELRKKYGTVQKYLEFLRNTRANIGQGTSESSGEVVYDTSGKRVQ